jgi:hypothetical protein
LQPAAVIASISPFLQCGSCFVKECLSALMAEHIEGREDNSLGGGLAGVEQHLKQEKENMWTKERSNQHQTASVLVVEI